jgi:protein gp37
MTRELFPLPAAAQVRPADEEATLAAEIRADHEEAERVIGKGMEAYRKVGLKLLRAKKKYGTHGKWIPWLTANMPFNRVQAWKYMNVARKWDQANVHPDEHLTLDQFAQAVQEEAPGDEPAEEVPYVTLERWGQMDRTQQAAALSADGDHRFNEQGANDNIEWALWSWNPITGCMHNCPYCYARDIAERFYEQKFVPSLWPSRLKDPRNTPFPAAKVEAEKAKATPEGDVRAMGLGNVFTCSMADLFGRWVPSEWVEAVLDAVRAAPQWTFLFLTKFPIRMAEFAFPDNAWVGTTVDCQARVKNAEKAFRKVKARVKWLSCEPLLEPLVFQDLAAFHWVVLGGSSRSTQTPEWHPPRPWVNALEEQAAKAGVTVYEKSNLLTRRRGYPGLPVVEPTEAPPELRYLPTDGSLQEK